LRVRPPEAHQVRVRPSNAVEALSSSSASTTGSESSRDGERPAIPETLPILPVRNTVIFPGMVVPLTVGRPSSRKLLEESLAQSKIIGVFTQKDPKQDEPAPGDLHRVGVAVSVLKLIRQNDEQAVVIAQALERITLRKALLTHPFIRAEVEVLASTPPPARDQQFEASVRSLRESAQAVRTARRGGRRLG